MGGRGSSSGSSGNGSLAKSAVSQDGSVIDLSDNPLRYGKNDAAISLEMRAALEAQENKRLNAKVEYAYALDENGNPVGKEKRGGKSSCAIPYEMFAENGTLTHNHPRVGDEAGLLGGTFSTADLRGFGLRGIKTMRASASEGTYSITKGKNFDAQGLISFRNSLERRINKESTAKVKAAGERYKRGEITHTELMGIAKQVGNSALVEIHNELLANQKKYGYSYTLERRA